MLQWGVGVTEYWSDGATEWWTDHIARHFTIPSLLYSIPRQSSFAARQAARTPSLAADSMTLRLMPAGVSLTVW